MDTLDHYRQTIETTLQKYALVEYAHGDFHNETIFDRMADRYLVMSVGWDGKKRVHGCLIHIDIIAGKIWIQRDGTEYGIATELTTVGIPKTDIVLGFQPQAVRALTEFAVA